MNDDLRPVEDALRAAFARQEESTPPAGPVRAAIEAAVSRRRRRRRTAQAVGVALALFAVLSVPVLGRIGTAPATPEPAAPSPTTPGPGEPAEPMDFLVLGIDGGDGRRHGNRADTVLMVHVPADRSRLYLISLPRDLGVEIPGYGYDKLNAAFYLGSHRPGQRPDLARGAELTERTVAALTGVRFDGTATLNYQGLRQVTDAVGGVEVCLPDRVSSRHTGREYPTGCQHLDGARALDLLRQRVGMPEGAHDRDRNAQRFVKALLQKLRDPAIADNPGRIAEILAAAGTNLTLRLDGTTVPELAATLRPVAAAEPVGIGWTINPVRGVTGAWVETLDPAESHSLFEALRRDRLAEWVARHQHRVTG